MSEQTQTETPGSPNQHMHAHKQTRQSSLLRREEKKEKDTTHPLGEEDGYSHG